MKFDALILKRQLIPWLWASANMQSNFRKVKRYETDVCIIIINIISLFLWYTQMLNFTETTRKWKTKKFESMQEINSG